MSTWLAQFGEPVEVVVVVVVVFDDDVADLDDDVAVTPVVVFALVAALPAPPDPLVARWN